MEFAPSPLPATEPPHDCPDCPRLVAFREELRAEYPGWWNAPVPAFGDPAAWLGIIGLAPGKHGANRTGRPFTGDYAGDLLYATLAKFGLSTGTYAAKPDDGVALTGAIVINAVKCLPPQNKPTPEEIRTCRPYLEAANCRRADRARLHRAGACRASVGGQDAGRAVAEMHVRASGRTSDARWPYPDR